MLRSFLIGSCLLPLVVSQVGFTLTRGRRENTYIHFELVATNLNAQLDPEVGAFRCTQPGLYFFTFTALAPQSDILKVSLRKNRIPVTTLFSSEASHSSVSGSMTLRLKSNDIVYPFIEDGNIYESTAKTRALTSFSGFQIAPAPNNGNLNEYSRTQEDDESEEFDADPNDKIEQLFKIRS